MTANINRLIRFERWMNPVAERRLGAQPDIDLVRLGRGGAQ
jgi:hypothetical protein